MLSGRSAGIFQSSLEAVCSDWSQEGGPDLTVGLTK